MKAELTAIIEPDPSGGYWAICPEVPGANGQGETIEETKLSLKQAIDLLTNNAAVEGCGQDARATWPGHSARSLSH
jgi:predicted RNase H-like HicB family nuclease